MPLPPSHTGQALPLAPCPLTAPSAFTALPPIMATISIRHDPEADLTVFTVHGPLDADEVIQAVTLEYATSPTLRILWDLTHSSVDHISPDGFRRIAAMAKNTRLGGRGAKTAYVGSEDLEYGLLRMYAALAEVAGVKAQYDVFRTLPEAFHWLGSGAGEVGDVSVQRHR